jgi:subtilisin family serine protease
MFSLRLFARFCVSVSVCGVTFVAHGQERVVPNRATAAMEPKVDASRIGRGPGGVAIPKMDPTVTRWLSENGEGFVPVILYLAEQPIHRLKPELERRHAFRKMAVETNLEGAFRTRDPRSQEVAQRADAEFTLQFRQELLGSLKRESEPSQREIEGVLGSIGARNVRALHILNMIRADVPREAVSLLESDPRIAEIGLDQEGEAQIATSTSALGAPTLWSLGYSGSGESVLVLDSGVNPSHPAFGGRVLAGVFLEANYSCPTVQRNDTFDYNGHGTHVAGIIASAGTATSPAYRGVAWGVSAIYSAKISCEDGRSTVFDPLFAVQTALSTTPIAVVNNSNNIKTVLEDDYYSRRVDEIVDSNNLTWVNSAGNSGPSNYTVGSPGMAYNVITVGNVNTFSGTNRNLAQIALDSSRGPTVGGRYKPDIVAPGVNIFSTAHNSTGFVAKSGTSMAAPHIAGAAVLLRQRGVRGRLQVKALLLNTTDAPGWRTDWGWGYSNLTRAESQADFGVTGVLDNAKGTVAFFKGTVPAGKALFGTLAWNRFVRNGFPYVRDLDFVAYRQSDGLILDASTLSLQNVEQIVVPTVATNTPVVLKVNAFNDGPGFNEPFAIALSEPGFLPASGMRLFSSCAVPASAPVSTVFAVNCTFGNNGDLPTSASSFQVGMVGGAVPVSVNLGPIGPGASVTRSINISAPSGIGSAEVLAVLAGSGYGVDVAAPQVRYPIQITSPAPPPQPPTLAAATPASSTATTQTFSLTARDANGFTDIARIFFLVNSNTSVPAGSCHGFYDRGLNGIYLYNDGLSQLLGPVTPGVAGTIQNGQCAINGASSGVTGSGTDLVLNLSVTRQGGYATGSRNLYIWVTDKSNTGTGWVQASSWTTGAAAAQPPTVVGAGPATASAVTQTFSLTARDPNGASDVSRVYFLLEANTSIAVGTCHGYYDRATNGIFLYNDALTSLQAGVTAGVSGTAQNSQCSISGAASSATTAGTDLVLNLSITRQGSYSSGTRNLYGWVTDSGGLGTGWIPLSVWTIGAAAAPQAPTLAVATPASSTTTTQVFSLTGRDGNGFSDIQRFYFLVNSDKSVPANTCHGFYDRSVNGLFLYNDALSVLLGPLVPGTAGTIQNGQCALNGAGSSATGSGTDVALTLSITRQGSYSSGGRNLYVWVTDNTGLGTGWVQASSWTIGAGVAQAPTVAGASPSTASVLSQTFVLTGRDGNGATDISRVYFLVNGDTSVPQGSCHGFYDRGVNSIYLYNDALTALVGPVTPGGAGTIQNGQCAISGATSSISIAGTDLALGLGITRQGSYSSGARNVYAWVVDQGGLGTGWVQSSTWTIGASAPQPPTLTSASPTISTTGTQTFSLTARDGNGYTDLSRIYFVVNSTPSVPANSCHGFYDRVAGAFFLYNDALTSVQGPLSPGAAGPLQNSQCLINGASSSVSAAGTDLTLNLSLTRQGSYATGSQNLYVWVADVSGAGTGWVQASTWIR